MSQPNPNAAEEMMETGESGGGIDLKEYGVVLLEKSWLIALCALVGLFAGLSYVKKLPVMFHAEAVLELRSEGPSPVQFQASGPPDLTSGERLQTVLASLRSRGFLKRVIEANQLQSDLRFMDPSPTGQPHDIDVTADYLGHIMEAEARPGTRLVNVSVEHGNPQLAQKLANSFVTEFIHQEVEKKAEVVRIEMKFLLAEAEKLKNKLTQSEQALQRYRQDYNAASLSERQDTVITALRTQSNQLNEAKAIRIRLEADFAEVQKNAGNAEKLLAIDSVASHPTVVDLQSQIATIETRISALALRYTDKHPRMIQERTLLADSKAGLKEVVLGIPQTIRSQYERAVATERNFEGALREQEKLALELDKQAIPYRVLERDVETNRALYESVLRRLKETDVSRGVESSNVQIFESAILPAGPIDPKKARLVAMAVAAGFIFGVMISFGLHLLDSSLKGVEQAERVTELTVLGAIPRRPKFEFVRPGSVLVDEPDTPLAEAFRSLRTSLYLASRKAGRKVCLFTSALSAEGKTFSSVNYAVSLAQQGLATVLMDADLRAPTLGQIFSIKDTTAGLADYLTGEAPIERVITETEIPNLFVIGAGHPTNNPAELLANRGFGTLLTELSARFDHIVIDTAPIIPVSDTLLLVEHAQTVCMVARANKTPRKWILRATHLLSKAGARPVGLILNQLPVSRISGYPYKYGGYRKAGYRGEAATAH